MKRDIDLIRTILLEVESQPIGQSNIDLDLKEYDELTIGEHVRLLKEAGYIDATIIPTLSPSGEEIVAGYSISRLLNGGHDFLDAARNETVWNKTKDKLKSVGGSVPLEIVVNVASQVLNHMLGI